jgi:hypothetical protein
MNVLLVALRLLSHMVVLFLAAAFTLGQLFSGHFSAGSTIATLGGVCAGLLGWLSDSPVIRRIVVAASAAGIAGAALHIYEYYSSGPRAGSYYPWFLTGPFIASLIIIAWPSLRPAQMETSPAGENRPAV